MLTFDSCDPLRMPWIFVGFGTLRGWFGMGRKKDKIMAGFLLGIHGYPTVVTSLLFPTSFLVLCLQAK